MSSMIEISTTEDLMELTTPLNNVTPSESDPATTNKYANSPETSTESKNLACPSKPESPCSCGVQVGLIAVVVAMLLYAVAVTSMLILLRRKLSTTTGTSEPDHYTDLQPRPQTDTTYQEMAISLADSSKQPGESHLQSSDLVYENQNVAHYMQTK